MRPRKKNFVLSSDKRTLHFQELGSNCKYCPFYYIHCCNGIFNTQFEDTIRYKIEKVERKLIDMFNETNKTSHNINYIDGGYEEHKGGWSD